MKRFAVAIALVFSLAGAAAGLLSGRLAVHAQSAGPVAAPDAGAAAAPAPAVTGAPAAQTPPAELSPAGPAAPSAPPDAPLPTAAALAPKSADPIANLAPESRAAAYAPAAPLATPLLRMARIRPEQLCTALEATGYVMSPWRASHYSNGEWRCISEIRLGPAPEAAVAAAEPETEAPRPNSLFVAVHGPDSHTIGLIRLKLNIEHRAAAAQAKTELKATVAAIYAALGWPEPDGLFRAIDNLDRYDRRTSGVRVAFSRERGDVPRFNLVIDPPSRDDGPRADAFRIAR
ncbi:DUF6030 family protein [Methylobrevis albus]|uniref:Uncharacterized protein n=1 Tax=Methylobrevis albus TaxID=2793297 RepID=A0A931HZ37_9HYPH|nr:DUF6030 family protein [Methylobrevis albus]MBH0237407.1 hypothetical protein [Methylobrevis albus]